MAIRYSSLLLVLMFFSNTVAAALDYKLKAREIASNTWLLEGANENFTRKNGGNIANIVFVVTEEGVVLFDTGPSLRYGNALKEVIASITDKPVVKVFNSHHHPDHFLGNQAFKESTIASLPGTGKMMATEGEAFATNMYALIGDWMRGTSVHLPDEPLESDSLTLVRTILSFIALPGIAAAIW